MRRLIYILILLTSIQLSISAQNFERISIGDEPDEYYIALAPSSENIKGVLVLMPGFAQPAESIFPESKIQNVAFANSILSIAIPCQPKLYADSIVIEKLNKTLNHVKTKYNVSAEDFVLGGFSAGGTISLRYAEYCYQKPDEASIKPQAVFTVDSPVDLFHIWNYFDRELKKNFSEAGVNEAKYVQGLMLKEIGSPEDNRDVWNAFTPFNMESDAKGNEQHLESIAIRVYHDIDVNWLINERHRSLMDTNALPASELINRLKQYGNNKAEFMIAKNEGYRSSGLRHPHSWSIVDEIELIQWVKKQLDK
ncbi:hypothetical protein GCM10027429_16190 [Marivirga atlantica]|jgi:hypothetical protein|uniref:Alpha/beta hydrolase n=1 Tax=Marivirga atlantica TaxID=1548457 RepID=A0A937AAD9_9BACT|nr:hypothetical protein [Marivirga atlantica]MBL0765236.1 hypothetical protein [Marivirga atlantica]